MCNHSAWKYVMKQPQKNNFEPIIRCKKNSFKLFFLLFWLDTIVQTHTMEPIFLTTKDIRNLGEPALLGQCFLCPTGGVRRPPGFNCLSAAVGSKNRGSARWVSTSVVKHPSKQGGRWSKHGFTRIYRALNMNMNKTTAPHTFWPLLQCWPKNFLKFPQNLTTNKLNPPKNVDHHYCFDPTKMLTPNKF